MTPLLDLFKLAKFQSSPLPKLSIVIAVRSGVEPALNCLRSLEGLEKPCDLEIIAVNCVGHAAGHEIEQRFPGVRVSAAPPDASIARQRNAGVEIASGDIIAVLHERYIVRPDWLRAILDAHQGACDVAGGCVAPGRSLSLAEWAMYLSEYSHIAPELPGGPLDYDGATMLPGGNVSYKRRVFDRSRMAEAMWELDFHADLFRKGAKFLRSEQMQAEYSYPHSLRDYLAERWQVSRDFARLRSSGVGLPKRLFIAATRIVLPALVWARIAQNVFRRGRNRFRFLLASPWIALFGLVQMAAEIAGYVGG